MLQEFLSGTGQSGRHKTNSSPFHGLSNVAKRSICILYRPLKAQVHNCQLLVDLAGRNALWGAAAHLFMAFKPLVPKPPPSPPGPPASPTPAQASNLQKAPSGLQREGSGLSRMGSRKGSLGATPIADTKLLSQDSFTQGTVVIAVYATDLPSHLLHMA